jgi:hypothetical protein
MLTLSSRESVHELTLNPQVATTISFPSEITLVTGYGMVLDAARAQELIDSEHVAAATLKELAPEKVTIVHYALASKDTLVMRAFRRGTPCYVSVRCGPKIHLFKFVSGDNANIAVVVSDKAPGSEGTIELKKPDILKARIDFNSTELLSALSRAKSRAFLETVNPVLYDGWSQRRGQNLVSHTGDLTTTITEIQQWPQKDALVFRCRVTNNGEKELRFKPSDVRVRVGDAAYVVQLADSSGVVPPGGTTLLDLVLQGNAAGGAEHLSISNDFRLEVAIDHSPWPPRDLLPPPNPLLPALERSDGMLEVPLEVPVANDTPSGKELRLPLPNFYHNK